LSILKLTKISPTFAGMKFVKLFLFSIIFVPFNFISQNNLIIFSESTQPIQIEYQNNLFPKNFQTDIKITNIIENPISIRIKFANPDIQKIDTTLFLFHPTKPVQNMDIIYLILSDNKTLKYLATLPSSNLKPDIPEIDTSIQVKTKEEKSIQKIIFFNDSNSVCIENIDSSEFSKAMQYIYSTPNQDRKIVHIEQFIKHNCFSPKQAESIIEAVPFEVEKVKIMKSLIPKITSVFDLTHWKDFLKYDIAKQTFIEYYNDYLTKLNTQPLLNDSIQNVYLNKVNQLDSDYEKTKFLKTIFSHYSITFNQLKSFITSLQHDQYKEELLKCTFYSLKNKNDFEKTFQLLQFSETKKRLNQFYEQQKK
jgi:hypothetical protein